MQCCLECSLGEARCDGVTPDSGSTMTLLSKGNDVSIRAFSIVGQVKSDGKDDASEQGDVDESSDADTAGGEASSNLRCNTAGKDVSRGYRPSAEYAWRLRVQCDTRDRRPLDQDEPVYTDHQELHGRRSCESYSIEWDEERRVWKWGRKGWQVGQPAQLPPEVLLDR
jgi:hypothetical protein